MKVGNDDASGFAWANHTEKFDGKAWSTIHHIYPPGSTPYWWAFFVHEATHCVEWMLEDAGYADLRNNDDAWWGACYPTIASSPIVPTPENVTNSADPTDTRLYAMHQRIKKSWLAIAPKWGKVTTDATKLENYGELLTYACPDEHAIVETVWSVHYRDLPLTDKECASIAAQIAALTAEKQVLQADLQTASPGQKPGLVAQIKALSTQIAALNAKQKICDAKAALLAK